MRNRFSLEALAFQNGDFFKELTQAVESLRDINKREKIKVKEFFTHPSTMVMADVIRKYTNLDISFANGKGTGFATEILFVDANHIFLHQELFWIMKNIDSKFDPRSTIKEAMGRVKQAEAKGSVSIQTGKVSGIYEKLKVVIHIVRSLMLDAMAFTPQECAAIILHEVGHSFTMLELVGRTVRTNYVLSNLSGFLDKSISDDDRVAVYIQAAKSLEYDTVLTKELSECKNKNQLSIVLLDAQIVKAKSELGGSLYDSTTCEWLADQYTTRQGAGKELVTALDKYIPMYGRGGPEFQRWLNKVLVITLILTILSMGLILIPMIALILSDQGPSKKYELYDKPLARMERIRRDLVDRLKDPQMSKMDIASTLQSIEGIDVIAKSGKFNSDLLPGEKLGWLLRKDYRDPHRYEMLQKELESFGNSDLFVEAAKLKTI